MPISETTHSLPQLTHASNTETAQKRKKIWVSHLLLLQAIYILFIDAFLPLLSPTHKNSYFRYEDDVLPFQFHCQKSPSFPSLSYCFRLSVIKTRAREKLSISVEWFRWGSPRCRKIVWLVWHLTFVFCILAHGRRESWRGRKTYKERVM